MIEFLKLRVCSVRIKGHHALKWGMCSYSSKENSTSKVARQKTSVRVGFKLAVRGDTGAGGLVAALPCTVYCLAVPCRSKRRPSPFVLVSQPNLTRLRAYLARTTRVH